LFQGSEGLKIEKASYLTILTTRKLVEADGIEPTTSGLQSRRSPNWATPPLIWLHRLKCRRDQEIGGPGKIWTSDLTLIKRAL
jgi:hypothetical protein